MKNLRIIGKFCKRKGKNNIIYDGLEIEKDVRPWIDVSAPTLSCTNIT